MDFLINLLWMHASRSWKWHYVEMLTDIYFILFILRFFHTLSTLITHLTPTWHKASYELYSNSNTKDITQTRIRNITYQNLLAKKKNFNSQVLKTRANNQKIDHILRSTISCPTWYKMLITIIAPEPHKPNH